MQRVGHGGLVAALVLAIGATGVRADDAEAGVESFARQHDAVSGLAAINLYTTFGGLGLAADGFEKGTHDAAQTGRVATEVVKVSELAAKLLKDAARENPRLAKSVPVDQLVEAYYLLDRDARLLGVAAKSGKKDDLTAFRRSRETTWKTVAKLLGLDEKKPAAGESKEESP